MSDITKKILSLEPEIEAQTQPKSKAKARPVKDNIIRSVTVESAITQKQTVKPSSAHASDIPSLRGSLSKSETYPDFITREDFITPKNAAPTNMSKTSNLAPQYMTPAPKTAWIMWTGIALTLIWIGASAAVYFGLFGTAISALTPMALSGLILAVLLPAILINLLWLTWRRLAHISHEAGRVAHAAQLLTRADETALTNTRNLAVSIQSELSLVDEHLNKMLNRFEGLKNDITAHSQDINSIGLTLTERSDDVGRSLTLQRQALESITSTFDTRMETLGNTIETQSLKLSEMTDVAAKNIETAELSLTQATKKLGKTGEDLSQTSQNAAQTIENSAESLSNNHDQLSALHNKIADLIAALTAQQDKVKADLAAQSENLSDMSKMAKSSTDNLQQNLSLGTDLLTALGNANQGTQETVQKRFSDMERMMEETQNRADSLAGSANSRIRDSLSQTRKDLSKLETDMQALSAQLTNAREQSAQLDLDTIERQKTQQQAGFGRLQLKPLETDFPPVEPPRFPARDGSESQVPLDFTDKDILDADTVFADEISKQSSGPYSLGNTVSANSDLDTPINLGADMEIVNPDAELTDFDPDVLRPAAPSGAQDRGLVGKGFGKSRNNKEKAKSGWRWRDMLGGLERPDVISDTVLAEPLDAQINPAAAPLNAPLSAPPLSAPPMDMTDLSDNIISRLTTLKLSPAAIVDKGTVTEAAKARIKSGPATMLKVVDKRLNAPVAHLRTQLGRSTDFNNTAKSFVTQYGQTVVQASTDDKALRDRLGSPQGRAYLLCAAALS